MDIVANHLGIESSAVEEFVLDSQEVNIGKEK